MHEGDVEQIQLLYDNSTSDKIVAIGEIGFDSGGDILKQRRNFIEQIELANYLQLPIIIHSRNTNEEVMKIIESFPSQYGFVFHCFQPDIEIAIKIVKMGGYLSFATPITKSTAKKSLEVINLVPINHILIELDYPYMSQDTIRDGQNVFNRIKDIKQLSYEELECNLDDNVKRLFKKLNIS